jgi:hypothetical protein
MTNIEFDQNEIKLILETLLYSASVDVCANWYKEDLYKMIELAQKIRSKNSNIPLEDVYLIESNKIEYHDYITNDICESFPDLKIIKN